MDVYHSFGLLIGTETGDPPSGPEDEDAPLRANRFPYKGKFPKGDDYDKILVERAVMADPEGLPATVLRLAMIHGPGDYQHRTKAYLDRMDAGERTIEIGQTQAKWVTSRGHVGNVAEAIARSVTDPRAANRIYNVCDAPNLSEIDWLRAIGEAAGWDGQAVVVPDGQAPGEEGDDTNYSIHLDASSERIRRELDLPAPIPLAEALRGTIAWERSLPKEAPTPS
jgi:nucleoside-diphosphate-sugar epimerase